MWLGVPASEPVGGRYGPQNRDPTLLAHLLPSAGTTAWPGLGGNILCVQEEECGYLPLRHPGRLQQLQAPDFLLKRLCSLYSHSPCSTNCLLRHAVPDLSSQPLEDAGFADYYTLIHTRNTFFPLLSSKYFSHG